MNDRTLNLTRRTGMDKNSCTYRRPYRREGWDPFGGSQAKVEEQDLILAVALGEIPPTETYFEEKSSCAETYDRQITPRRRVLASPARSLTSKAENMFAWSDGTPLPDERDVPSWLLNRTPIPF
jgi:hypothetical protein